MLVDLARNDLSRNATNIKIETFREVQFYSHVIHLVSKVSGELPKDYNTFDLIGNTFPAGTLSGAPKYKAIELIDKYEPTSRGFYGGCIGSIGFNLRPERPVIGNPEPKLGYSDMSIGKTMFI